MASAAAWIQNLGETEIETQEIRTYILIKSNCLLQAEDLSWNETPVLRVWEEADKAERYRLWSLIPSPDPIAILLLPLTITMK